MGNGGGAAQGGVAGPYAITELDGEGERAMVNGCRDTGRPLDQSTVGCPVARPAGSPAKIFDGRRKRPPRAVCVCDAPPVGRRGIPFSAIPCLAVGREIPYCWVRMIRFSIFGIPVEIQPWFWVAGAVLGGALTARTPQELQSVLVFLVIVLLSVLAHELGHATVGMRVGGGQAAIVLWAFGGLAYNRGGRFTNTGRFWMLAAGPGAGFALAALTVVGLWLAFGLGGGSFIASGLLFGEGWGVPTREVVQFLGGPPSRVWVVRDLLWVNFWWSVINLLPVLPLDGGQISALWLTPRDRVLKLSRATGVVVALLGAVWLHDAYLALLFGWLAWQSHGELQQSRGF